MWPHECRRAGCTLHRTTRPLKTKDDSATIALEYGDLTPLFVSLTFAIA
jgi:hypothetical protein